MSVGKTSDDKNISILTNDAVIVHKEEDVIITGKAPYGTGGSILVTRNESVI